MPSQALSLDVSPQWLADSMIHRNNIHFHHLLEKLPTGAYTCDPDGLITYFNPQAVELWGRAPMLNDPVDRYCGSFKLFSVEGFPITHDDCWMARALRMKQGFNGCEILIERPNGERLTALAYANPLYDDGAQLIGAVNVLVDISERKRAEDMLRLHQQEIEELNRRLKSAMMETHHRVKNNLQIIAAMIDLRLMDSPKSVSPEELRRIGNHTRTLAAMHDLLTQEAKDDGDAHSLSARELMQKLVFLLQQGADNRTFKLYFEDARLNARQSASLALIVSELVNNAIKYGAREVGVMFRTTDGVGSLEVSDDGQGFPPGFDVHQAANTGLELVENLTRWDLAGEVSYSNRSEGGATVTVILPLS